MRAQHPAWIEIDLGQFKKNLAVIRSWIGTRRFCLPVKANAYGHGLVPMAKAAAQAGVDCLAVSCLAEGYKLRRAGIEIPILVFGAIHEEQVGDLIELGLEFSISSKFKADLVAARCRGKCRVHLEVDTGMQRTGVRCATAVELFAHLKKLGCFDVAGIYSHLATGDAPGDAVAEKQIGMFRQMLQHPVFEGEKLIAHMANSNGVLHYPSSYFDMVRPGLLAYGYGGREGISPCFSLKSKVSFFKVVAAGEGISYGHTYVTQKQTRVATVPVGYGDGYRRTLSNRGSVLIRGRKVPIAGAICMDQFMVDVGDGEAYVGDEAVLIGKQGDQQISLMEMARLCDTIPYEILCLLNERIPRVYSDSKSV